MTWCSHPHPDSPSLSLTHPLTLSRSDHCRVYSVDTLCVSRGGWTCALYIGDSQNSLVQNSRTLCTLGSRFVHYDTSAVFVFDSNGEQHTHRQTQTYIDYTYRKYIRHILTYMCAIRNVRRTIELKTQPQNYYVCVFSVCQLQQ